MLQWSSSWHCWTTSYRSLQRYLTCLYLSHSVLWPNMSKLAICGHQKMCVKYRQVRYPLIKRAIWCNSTVPTRSLFYAQFHCQKLIFFQILLFQFTIVECKLGEGHPVEQSPRKSFSWQMERDYIGHISNLWPFKFSHWFFFVPPHATVIKSQLRRATGTATTASREIAGGEDKLSVRAHNVWMWSTNKKTILFNLGLARQKGWEEGGGACLGQRQLRVQLLQLRVGTYFK